uniref:Uncharacterized protein n=1 Tax=Vespula pensylvanica TaxID=30213 RepID=A0A834P2E3_VESPE|nr:hypothetical protein H0235_008056 [Vespula pensylvanica]
MRSGRANTPKRSGSLRFTRNPHREKKQERWPSKWARVHVLEGEEFISPAHSWDKEWGLDLPDGFTPNAMQRRYRESDFPSSVHDNKHRDCHASFLR